MRDAHVAAPGVVYNIGGWSMYKDEGARGQGAPPVVLWAQRKTRRPCRPALETYEAARQAVLEEVAEGLGLRPYWVYDADAEGELVLLRIEASVEEMWRLLSELSDLGVGGLRLEAESLGQVDALDSVAGCVVAEADWEYEDEPTGRDPEITQ